MNNKPRLNERWLKSAIIGTVWASSEIVLGSFLHNLRVPFSGSILTAISLLILISVSYVWKDRGIFWRAGLICALMKTMSPSAVIFGPMVAIFTESVLLEISVRTLGRNYLGFIVGSILAVSWSLVQKIINYLIFYGFKIVELYKSLMIFTEKQFKFQFDTLWFPIFLLLAVYVFIGFISAITGIKTGKKIIAQPAEHKAQQYNNQHLLKSPNSKNNFNYSIAWLIADIVLIVSSLALISLADWKIWVPLTPIIVIVWVLRYKRALRQLVRPKFWIFFVAITMLSAFLFTKLQSKPSLDALIIGLEMNFRASILILGFSVLGTELYNPKIRHFFHQTRFKQLLLAMELSAESLPAIIANIPDFKTIIRNPVSVVSKLIAYSEFRFSELKKEQYLRPKIFLLTGKVDSGKTTFVKNLIEKLKEKEVKVGGIYSQKIFENNERTGYDLVEIETQKTEHFLRKNPDGNPGDIGVFKLFPKAVPFGMEILNTKKTKGKQLIIIDEIGPFELSGKGWAKSLEDLLRFRENHVLIVVRESLVEQVIEKWNLENPLIIKFPDTNPDKTTEQIVNEVTL